MNVAIIRAKREFKMCCEKTPSPFKVSLKNDDDLLVWTIIYTPDTPIFKKTYELILNIPKDYPFSAPTILFNDYVYHPNIDKNGKMCLEILNEWQSKFSIPIILEAFHQQFIQPNLENPTNIEASEMFGKHIENYKNKINK